MKPKKGELIVVIGPPGSGKTTVSRQYQESGYLLFDNDRIIEAMWGKLQFYPEIKHLGKRMCRDGMTLAMATGLSVVVTISGRTKAERAKILNLAPTGYTKRIVHCHADAALCLGRCKADPARPKSTDWETIINNWFKRFEKVEPDEAQDYQIVEEVPSQ
jgi:shikimate kinase